MFDKYLITGATGFLGNTVMNQLLEQGNNQIRVFVLPNDRGLDKIPSCVEIVYGDITDYNSLLPFFSDLPNNVCLIHCAGIVSIASKKSELLYKVNVEGTKNIMNLALTNNIKKVVYVSSVHAIKEEPKGKTIQETKIFSSDIVKGQYAKTKAMASEYVLKMAEKGLDVSIVHPSGIIGPNDFIMGSITKMIISYCKGHLPFGIKGGYDFVDVRDVSKGIISCTVNGKKGECYLLSNEYITIKELISIIRKIINGKKVLAYLPIWVAKIFAPCYEIHCLRKKLPLYFTPYSIVTLGTNASFTNEKAKNALNFQPRLIATTLADTIEWLKSEKKI